MNNLRACGFTPNLLRVIGFTYSGTKASVLTPDRATDRFELLTAVLQGHTFIIVLDYALKRPLMTMKSLALLEIQEDLGGQEQRRY